MVRQTNRGKRFLTTPSLHIPLRFREEWRADFTFVRQMVSLFALLVLNLALLHRAAAAEATSRTSSVHSPETASGAGPAVDMKRIAEAQSYKRLGDRYVSEDSIQEAAAAYQRALSLDREQFTRDDRVQMAVYLSWDNRLGAAIRELRLVLDEDPSDLSARLHLARIYGWSGDLKQSISEADAVLAEQPDQKDALLIKANALEWQGRYGKAIPIYEEIIKDDGDFDAKVGLSSALLYKGDRAGAERQARGLTAENPRQERKLSSLHESIDSETRPRFDFRYGRYADEDHNLSDRYAARYNFPIGNQEFSLDLEHTEASGADSRARADDFSFQTQFNHAGSIGFGGAIGLSSLHGGSTAQYPTGKIRIDGRLSHTTLVVTMGTAMLTDTSELIENHIRRTSASIEVMQRIHDRFLLSGSYARMRLSDGNDANDAQMQSEYRISLAPRIAFGYRGRFLDFERQNRSGYFDPDNYVSHRVYSGFYLKRSWFFTDLEVYYGKQNFTRYGERTNDWITGAAGSVGFMPVRGLVLEVNASGGDFAAGSVSGFRYFTLGSLVSYRF